MRFSCDGRCVSGVLACAIAAVILLAPRGAARAGDESPAAVPESPAVKAALDWLARHQMPNGSWSFQEFRQRCNDAACTGPGSAKADAAATALALMPFLNAGHTHKNRGPHQKTVYRGLLRLMMNQKDDGRLSSDAGQMMYAHGMATIALSEAYGRTKDPSLRRSAQSAIRFIEKAQHPRTGGWRYHPGEEGDTSVVGWQVAALKSGQAAGLAVDPKAFEGAKRWLGSCSKGTHGGLFSYTPESGVTPTMTAVGVVCHQRLGMARQHPLIHEGVAVLARHMPDDGARNLYYWHYATHAMRNASGPEWQRWRDRVRLLLVSTQCGEGCSAGSWDPDRPTKDVWGDAGGRIFMTAFAATILRAVDGDAARPSGGQER